VTSSAICVRLRMVLGAFFGTMHRVKVMPVREMRVVAGLLVLGGAMVLSRLAVMSG